MRGAHQRGLRARLALVAVLLAVGLVAAVVITQTPPRQRSADRGRVRVHRSAPHVAAKPLNSSSSTTLRRPSPASSTTVRRPPATSPTTAVRRAARPPYTPIGTYRVASSTLEVTDPPADPQASRVLPTALWYPAGPAGSTPSGAGHRAPYALIVFSQGYDMAASAYGPLLADWASAGFVVAAPTYPHTSPSDPSALDENDIVNHPADLRAVIAAVIRASTTSASPLAGRVNPSEVGVAGHSDGADVALAVADNTCCRDALVKAVAVMSGAELASFGGRYYGAGPAVPLLAIQGSADTINSPFCGVQLYDAAPSPKYYLDLVGAGHLSPYIGDSPYQKIATRVTTDFFDAELAHQPAAVAALSRAGSVPGAALSADRAASSSVAGPCPGAPSGP